MSQETDKFKAELLASLKGETGPETIDVLIGMILQERRAKETFENANDENMRLLAECAEDRKNLQEALRLAKQG